MVVYGVLASMSEQLQRVQNTSAKIVVGAYKYEHVIPILKELPSLIQVGGILSGGHFEKVEKVLFQDGVTHVSDNTEYKCTNIHVAEKHHKSFSIH